MRTAGDGEHARTGTGPDTRRTRTLAGLPLLDDGPLRAGDVIAGRYRIDRVLGVGGMGIVFSGLHLDLEQPVAIKLILPAAINNKEVRERFLREARAAARLKSEHVAKVLDVGQLESGAPYMVMELLEGCDLAAFLAQNGRVTARTAADFIAQACEAVAEAHAQGIVHRDLKPQNLFLTTCVGGDALIKVLDFGVSKVSVAGVDSLTKSMMVMGSPLYMSPEQMRSSRSVDRRTDIWALGVVLFELLAGHPPFDGESIPALCLKVAADAPPSLALERPDLPPGLAAVVMRCLEKQPENRYADVGELAAALSPFVGSASSVSIARTRMVASGTRRSGSMSSEVPVALPSAAWPVKKTQGAGFAMAVVVCAAIVGAAGWRYTRVETARSPAAGAASIVAAPPSEPPAPRNVEVSPPAPSTPPLAPSAAPTALSPKPRAPTHATPHAPSRPGSLDDDIPSMRTPGRSPPRPVPAESDIPSMR